MLNGKAHSQHLPGMRKTAENPELIVDMFDRVTREHNNHGIDHTGTSKCMAWPARESCRDPDLDTKGVDSGHWSNVHVVQPDVHSLIWVTVSFLPYVTVPAGKRRFRRCFARNKGLFRR